MEVESFYLLMYFYQTRIKSMKSRRESPTRKEHLCPDEEMDFKLNTPKVNFSRDADSGKCFVFIGGVYMNILSIEWLIVVAHFRTSSCVFTVMLLYFLIFHFPFYPLIEKPIILSTGTDAVLA